VTDAEIESYYRGHQSDFIRTEPELRLSVIVLDSEQDARETWKLLSRREKDFESMAREQSADAVSSEKDGDLGYVKKSDIGIRKVQDTVFSLRAGQLSQPIQTETGYCIFKVNDRHESGSIRPLEEVRGEIVNRVLEERRRNRIKQFVEDIRKESEVEVHEDLINEAAANSTAMQ
jgi:parvulin-like peptidyl-prolyl isomerase